MKLSLSGAAPTPELPPSEEVNNIDTSKKSAIDAELEDLRSQLKDN